MNVLYISSVIIEKITSKLSENKLQIKCLNALTHFFKLFSNRNIFSENRNIFSHEFQ